MLQIIATVSASLAAISSTFASEDPAIVLTNKGANLSASIQNQQSVLFSSKDSWQKNKNCRMFDRREKVSSRSPEVIDYHIHSYVNSTEAISDNTTHSTFKRCFHTNCWIVIIVVTVINHLYANPEPHSTRS